MKRIPVTSSLAASLGYDPENSILEVEFKDSGDVWQYEGVSKNKYYEMMQSTSIGSYFRKFIKGHFPEKKVEDATRYTTQ